MTWKSARDRRYGNGVGVVYAVEEMPEGRVYWVGEDAVTPYGTASGTMTIRLGLAPMACGLEGIRSSCYPMTQWRFPSNSGHDEVTCTLLEVASTDPEWVLCDFVASCEDIDTIDVPVAGVGTNKVRRTQQLNISSILLSGRQLDALQKGLETWMQTRGSFLIDLGETPGKHLTIELGVNPRLISSTEHPALLVDFCGAGIDAEFFTIVDQTCVKIAYDSLRWALRDIRGAQGR